MGKSKHVAPVMAMIEARIRRLIDEEKELIRAMGKKYLDPKFENFSVNDIFFLLEEYMDIDHEAHELYDAMEKVQTNRQIRKELASLRMEIYEAY